MAIDLAALARQKGRKRDATLRPIFPTKAMALELAAAMAPAWRVWAERVDQLLAGYDPAPLRIGDTLTLDTPDQVQASIEQANAEFLTRLLTEITPALRRWAVSTERWHRAKWASAVRAGIDVDLSSVLSSTGMEETLAAFINRNVALTRNISDQTRARIADAVFRGYQERAAVRDVAREIREATDLGRQRALRIASDQNNKLSAALDVERQAEAGLTEYKWRHSGKLHPRESHKARDGKVYKLGQPDGDTPGQAPFCGCRAQAYVRIINEIA
jgi:SPP1 gp7 family putative phage head morphogenesis protein